MDQNQLKKMKQNFERIDRDHDGFISKEDLELFVQNRTIRQRVFGDMSILGEKPIHVPKDALDLADLDGDGAIGFTEAVAVWLYAESGEGVSYLKHAFDVLKGPDGLVSREDIGKVIVSSQKEMLIGDGLEANSILDIFPAGERMTLERFTQCLQIREDTGAPVAQLALRPAADGMADTVVEADPAVNTQWWCSCCPHDDVPAQARRDDRRRTDRRTMATIVDLDGYEADASDLGVSPSGQRQNGWFSHLCCTPNANGTTAR
jgi:hypothetical protein